MTGRTCGEALVALLEAYGIDTAFGIPGVHTIELYRGLVDRSLRHILTRHEQGAGFMADGFARATGRPAACFLISGPGLTNAATPIAQAYSDSQPMVVVASTNMRSEIGKGWGPFHELRNQRLIAEQFCAYAGQAWGPEDIPDIVAQAYAAMSTGRPRPVYIEIPRDILALPAAGDWTVRRPGARPGPAVAEVQAAADLLATAERPLLLVGAGASDAFQSVRALADRIRMPVISSFCGKGVVSELSDRVLGAALSMPSARGMVEDADVVLAIGTELSTVDASNQSLTFGGRLIRMDVDPKTMSDRYPAAVPIVSDALLGSAALLAAMETRSVCGPSAEWITRFETVRAGFATFGSARAPEHRAVLRVLQQAVPDDAIFVGDMTQLAYTGNHAFKATYPRTWLHPASYATLGYALPTAIGAKAGCPDRTVVSIAGDCGFQFTCQELATRRRS